MNRNPMNRVVAADDLHWNRVEGKYTTLSEPEVTVVLDVGVACGLKTEAELKILLRWAGVARMHTLLLKNLLEGRLRVGISKGGEVVFGPRADL